MAGDSSVGTATRYELDGPGIESRWRRIFRTRPDRASFPGESGQGVALTTHPN